MQSIITNLSKLTSPTTNMISLYIPKDYNIYKVKEFITKELSSCSNIKDKNNKDKVIDALKSINVQLGNIKSLDYGMVIFTGSCI